MKIKFYSEGLTEKFERFSFIGIQLLKNEDGEYYLAIWLLGVGMAIVFNPTPEDIR